MRLLADENFPVASSRVLRAAGHDVLAASETMPGASDRTLLARADDEQRLLVTFDRDFGALAMQVGVAAPAGVLLLRFVPVHAEEPAAILLDVLSNSAVKLAGRLTVIDRDRVRQRALRSS